MLIISRKKNEKILIGGGAIEITVLRLVGKHVRFGIRAPKHIVIDTGATVSARQMPYKAEDDERGLERIPGATRAS
jgi:hypothetical protein